MSAYFVVELEITNQEAMEPYRTAVGARSSNMSAARGGATELIEGKPEPKRIVILEFSGKSSGRLRAGCKQFPTPGADICILCYQLDLIRNDQSLLFLSWHRVGSRGTYS